MSNKIEKRTFELRAESQGDELALVGRAVTYNRISSNEISSNVRERIMPDAFADTLDDDDEDVKALVNHSSDRVLGRRANGTLQLRDNADFLGVRIQLDPAVQWHRDIYQQVKRGDLNEMSFAFRCDDESYDPGTDDDGKRCTIRSVKRAKLFDVSLVTSPFYGDGATVMQARSAGVHPTAREAAARLAAIDAAFEARCDAPR